MASDVIEREAQASLLVAIQRILAGYSDIENPHLAVTLTRHTEQHTAELRDLREMLADATDVLFHGKRLTRRKGKWRMWKEAVDANYRTMLTDEYDEPQAAWSAAKGEKE